MAAEARIRLIPVIDDLDPYQVADRFVRVRLWAGRRSGPPDWRQSSPREPAPAGGLSVLVARLNKLLTKASRNLLIRVFDVVCKQTEEITKDGIAKTD